MLKTLFCSWDTIEFHAASVQAFESFFAGNQIASDPIFPTDLDIISNTGLIAGDAVQRGAFPVIAEFSHITALAVVDAVITNAFVFVAYGSECVTLGVFLTGNCRGATNMLDTDESPFAVVIHVAFATGVFKADSFLAVRVVKAGRFVDAFAVKANLSVGTVGRQVTLYASLLVLVAPGA